MKLFKKCSNQLQRLWWKKITLKDQSITLYLDDRYKTPDEASDSIMQELRKMGKTCAYKGNQIMEIDGRDYFVSLGRSSTRIPTQYISLKQMDKMIDKDGSFELLLDAKYRTPLAASDCIIRKLQAKGIDCVLKSEQVMEIDQRDYAVTLETRYPNTLGQTSGLVPLHVAVLRVVK